jgi:hypothetical protein
MAAKKQTQASEPKANGGKQWTRIERKRYRYWAPTQDGAALYGVIQERSERGGKFGLRAFYVVRATEDTDDKKGDIMVGDVVGVNEYATLRGLADLVGKEVRILPAGYDDRVKLFDVDVAS